MHSPTALDIVVQYCLFQEGLDHKVLLYYYNQPFHRCTGFFNQSTLTKFNLSSISGDLDAQKSKCIVFTTEGKILFQVSDDGIDGHGGVTKE